MNSLTRKAAMVAALSAVAALGAPAAADAAKNHNGHGVRAEIRGATLTVKGSDRGDALALRLAAGDPTRVQVDSGDDGSADFSFARSNLSAIKVRAGGGDDSVRIDDTNGAFNDSIPTTIAGGRGNDSLNGGSGAEAFRGGRGSDTVVGGRGNDSAYLGRGNDAFVWNPGDGSDVIEGRHGRDTMRFNGSNAPENVTLSSNAGRLKFFRDVAGITMDTDGIETVDFNAVGGADNITVGDLTATEVTKTNLDLAGTLGGSAGDGAVDNVFVTGTNGNDRIRVNGSGSRADVTGLATAVSVTHAEPTDRLSLNTLGGRDTVLLQRVAGVLQVLIDGSPA